MEGPTEEEKRILVKMDTIWSKIKSPAKWVLIILLGVSSANFLQPSFSTPRSEDTDSSIPENSADSESDSCPIVGINIHGTLLTYIPDHSDNDSFFDYDVTASEQVVWKIQQANKDDAVKAILVEVDSGGGSPVGGEEIDAAVKNSTKPVVAFIRNSGASAAYFAVSSADRIFGSKYSNIGSIGVTGSYLNNVAKNKKDGYTYEQLIAGKFKDSGNPNKALTTEEKALFLRDVNIMYENFIKAVSENRKIPIEKVRTFADGSTVLGAKAIELGLIDDIGGMDEAEKYIEGITKEESVICWK